MSQPVDNQVSFFDGIRKVCSDYVWPFVEDVSGYVNKCVTVVGKKYQQLQTKVTDFVEKSFGQTAAKVSSIVMETLPEIAMFTSGFMGGTSVPSLIAATRTLSNFSGVIEKACQEGKSEALSKEVELCVYRVGYRAQQGAILSSLLIGGLQAVKTMVNNPFSGVLSPSLPFVMGVISADKVLSTPSPSRFAELHKLSCSCFAPLASSSSIPVSSSASAPSSDISMHPAVPVTLQPKEK